MNPKNICSVVVTYNRKELLVECIQGLLAQTCYIDKIFIIDNASSDGTQTLLQEQVWFNDPRVSYERLETNTGGAGGFYAGLKKAYEEGFKWYWLMDDDVEPDPKCLNNLMKWNTVSQCIHPRRYYNKNEFCKWECFINPSTGMRVSLEDISFLNGRKICFTNTACFEGMLISNEVISEIGFPDPSYFIVYDDTVYGLKASLYTPVAYVSDALMKKKINKEQQPISSFFIYYSMRNYFARQRVVQSIYGSKKWRLNISILMVFLGYLKYLIIKSPEKFKGLRSLFKGAWHGLLNKK